MPQSKNIIETFKRHIKEQGINTEQLAQNALSSIQAIKSAKIHLPFLTERKIRNFGEDIKSANELTGALQTLQITFRKILSMLDEENLASNNDLISQVQERINLTTFMGDGLFDTALNATIGGQEILLENPSPMPLLTSRKIDDFRDYVNDKLLEINEVLQNVSKAISNAEIFDNAEVVGEFDCSVFEKFDKNVFKNMK